MTDYPPVQPPPEGDAPESDPIALTASGGIMFFEIWLLALTRPREETFRTIVGDPGATIGRAAIWIFISSLISYGIAMALQFGQMAALFSQFEESGTSLGAMAGGGALFLLCGLPLVAALAVVGAMVSTAILQFVAGALGGEGDFRELFFGTASITAPMTLITTALSLIPLVGGCLALPLSLYSAYLTALALKAVNRIGWGSAIVTLLVPVVITVLVGLIVLVLLFPLMQDVIPSGIGTF